MVTPFDERGRIDEPGVARLMAFFEAAGCQGVVLAGTNGEGPSLSAVEKRDLIMHPEKWAGKLLRILGIATSSLDEAIWSCRRAADGGASAVLVMAPSYFRSASEPGISDWFRRVLDASPVPVLVYNFPRMTGFTMSAAFLAGLSDHENLLGAKDSSGEAANLFPYRQALGENRNLFIGDEQHLVPALEAGWSGTISGCANILPAWLSRIVSEWDMEEWRESAETKFELIKPLITLIRSSPQPGSHKAILERIGVIDSGRLRLPLTEPDPATITALIQEIEAVVGPLAGYPYAGSNQL